MKQQKLIYAKGFFISFDEKESPLLYKKGFYGKPLGIVKPKTPIFNAKMQFSFYETLYLLKKGYVEVFTFKGKKMEYDELIKEANNYIDNFEAKYLVYEDLKEKGYILKPGMKYGVTFLVYKYGPGIDHAPFLVDVIIKGEKISANEIIRAGRLSHSVKKKLLLSLVDLNAKSISYYLFKWFL